MVSTNGHGRARVEQDPADDASADATITGPHSVALAQAPEKPAPEVASLEGERILIAAGSDERLFPGMTVGEAGHETTAGALADVAGREDDSFRVIVAEAEDGIGELIAETCVDAKRR